MLAEIAFTLLNLAVLPWWLLWLGAPHSKLGLRAAGHSAICIGLCLVYAVLISAALLTAPPLGLGLAALKAALATDLGFLAGWTHYLAFDLFVGAWIVRESRRLRLEPRPYLVPALLLGPLGLGAFLLHRGRRLRSYGSLGASDLL